MALHSLPAVSQQKREPQPPAIWPQTHCDGSSPWVHHPEQASPSQLSKRPPLADVVPVQPLQSALGTHAPKGLQRTSPGPNPMALRDWYHQLIHSGIERHASTSGAAARRCSGAGLRLQRRTALVERGGKRLVRAPEPEASRTRRGHSPGSRDGRVQRPVAIHRCLCAVTGTSCRRGTTSHHNTSRRDTRLGWAHRGTVRSSTPPSTACLRSSPATHRSPRASRSLRRPKSSPPARSARLANHLRCTRGEPPLGQSRVARAGSRGLYSIPGIPSGSRPHSRVRSGPRRRRGASGGTSRSRLGGRRSRFGRGGIRR